jgi:NTP pyrophosphatase (non-canonical NTP hydrolase)
MNLQDYISKAIETESVIDNDTTDVQHLTYVLEATIAAGNLLDVIKKDTFYGLPTDPKKASARQDRLALNAQALRRAAPLASAGTFPGDSAGPSPVRTLQKINPRVAHAIIGLATEAVELLEALHTAITEDTEIDGINILEELGDLNWYHAIAVDALGGDWEQIQEVNIAKLRSRNKGSKFSAEATIDRDIDAERNLLEERLNAGNVPDADAEGF